MNRLLAIALLLVAPAAAAQSEIILDNGTAAFSTVGTWPTSTAVSGFIGPNYQTHEANGAPASALVVDNTDAGFSVTGTWPVSTAVSGYLGSNYQVHAANGDMPGSIVADNSSGSATGTWSTSTAVAGFIGTNYQVHAAGTGANVFTWSINVPASGTFQVYARWTAHPNRATNAKYTVNSASGSQAVTVNMEQGGGQWNSLGSFSFNSGVATVSLSDDANENVIADAVMLVPDGAAPNTATWSVNVLQSGSYNVYARWTQHPNRATDAKYTVNHAAGATTVTVNQEAGGGNWSLLGTFNFNAGSASVNLTDQANGYVIADSVMLVPPGALANSATWTPNVAQAGTYQVYARWTQNANRATNAVYAVTHGAGSTNVTVNQQANGAAWNLLGTFALNPGTAHNVTLTDQANGFVVADAIRLVPVTLQPVTNLFFIETDHLNTPRVIFDANQQVRWKWDQQEAFGVNVPDEDPGGQGAFEFPQRFPGQYADKETNLDYNYLRDYDPSLGRYTQSDPIGAAGLLSRLGRNRLAIATTLTLYGYVGANPIDTVDPSGEFGVGALVVGGAVVLGGAAIAGGLIWFNSCLKHCNQYTGCPYKDDDENIEKRKQWWDQCMLGCTKAIDELFHAGTPGDMTPTSPKFP